VLSRALWYWWIIVIVAGALFNGYFALRLAQGGIVVGTIVFTGLCIGCLVLCYRTYEARDIFKKK
jgi:hypothetical protein